MNILVYIISRLVKDLKDTFMEIFFYLDLFKTLLLPRKETTMIESVSDEVMKITYQRNGQQYNVFIPFNRKKIAKMLGNSVLIPRGDGKDIDITQQAGLEYLVTPAMFDTEYFIIRNEFENEEIRCYGIPFHQDSRYEEIINPLDMTDEDPLDKKWLN